MDMVSECDGMVGSYSRLMDILIIDLFFIM